MSVRKILIWLGFFIALLPYLGLPSSLDALLSTCAGLAIVFFLLVRKSVKLVSAVDTPQMQSTSEKEPRMKGVVSKNASNMNREKPMIPEKKTESTPPPQASSVVDSAGAALPHISVNAARGQGARSARLNKP